MNQEHNPSPFVSSNPLYEVGTRQNFANEEIKFGPMIDAIEMLYKNMAFGNFFINLVDFRDYTYPYNSPNSLEVMGYRPEQITNIDWLLTIIHPTDLPIFLEYAQTVLNFIYTLPPERKKNTTINHCFRAFHGIRKEYFWLYQRNHMSYIDKNGAIVYSISVVTDVTHLNGSQKRPTWSVTERLKDGGAVYLIGSEITHSKSKPNKPLLTPRELEIINLSARGFANREIAKRLRIGYETIVTHRKKILVKTKSKNMPEAVSTAISLGYL